MVFNIGERMNPEQRDEFIQDLIDLLARHELSPMAVISTDKIRYQGEAWPGIMIPVTKSTVKQTVKEFRKNTGAKIPHYL